MTVTATTQTGLIALSDLSPADHGRWRELADAAAEPNPFYEPEFVSALAPVLGGRDLSLLVARRGSDWLACAPVHSPGRWHHMPLRGIANWQTPYTYLGSPLYRAGEGDEVLGELTASALATSGSFLGLDLLPADADSTATFVSRVAPAQSLIFKRFQRAVLIRRSDVHYLAIRPKHRREIQRLGRRLQEHLDTSLEVTDVAGEAAAVDEFLALERSGWKGRQGTAMAELEGHGAFFQRLCEGFARRGRLQLLALRANGRAIAMKCNLRAGSHLYCFKIAYDDAFARFSPGMQLELANIDAFVADDSVEMADSCAEPNNQMINRLWADRRELITVALGAPGVAGRAALASIRVAANARRLRGA